MKSDTAVALIIVRVVLCIVAASYGGQVGCIRWPRPPVLLIVLIKDVGVLYAIQEVIND